MAATRNKSTEAAPTDDEQHMQASDRAVASEPVARGLFSYSREVRKPGRPDGKESGFLSVSFPIYLEDDTETILAKARDAAFEAKSTVYQQLQLDFTVEEGVAVEMLQDAFGGTVEDSNYGSAPQQYSDATGVGPMPPYPADSADKAEKEANQRWGVQRFAQFPGEFWDNRGNKRNPKAPDLKHRSTGMPVWRV